MREHAPGPRAPADLLRHPLDHDPLHGVCRGAHLVDRHRLVDRALDQVRDGGGHVRRAHLMRDLMRVMKAHAVGEHLFEPGLEALDVEALAADQLAQAQLADQLRQRRRATHRLLAVLALADVPGDGVRGHRRQPLVLAEIPAACSACHVSSRASADGHQTLGPISSTRAGTRTLRTRKVSSSTPNATTNPISVRNTSGSTARTEKVPASTIPALVITPPVTASARSIPARVPCVSVSSRARAIRKML